MAPYLYLKKIAPTIWMISLCIVVYLSLSPEIKQPIQFWSSDKIYHVITYSWLALLPSAFFELHRIKQSTLFLFGMGVLLEAIQQLTGRQFSFIDMIANGVGIIIGWKLGLLLRKIVASE